MLPATVRHKRNSSRGPSCSDPILSWPDLHDDSRPVEASPNARFIRYPVLLGRGACKRVFKAFDTLEGVEVAWNQVELVGLEMEQEVRDRLFAEIHTLQALKHRNIMSFHAWWYSEHQQTINFITEVFTSGTLRQYRKRMRLGISEGVIKRWAWQILQGLLYLHGHEPPIVHRDLKCDNIFINGCTGQVKIGDLGLATSMQGLSVVGTPEFMAPEIYEEQYDEKVDIYSYGMCLLELATLEYPYSECHGVAHIYRKVTQGVKPLALERVPSPELRGLIELCIAHEPGDRPAARQLIKHPFFEQIRKEGSLAGSLHLGSSGQLGQYSSGGYPSTPHFGRMSSSSMSQHVSSGTTQQLLAHRHFVGSGTSLAALNEQAATGGSHSEQTVPSADNAHDAQQLQEPLNNGAHTRTVISIMNTTTTQGCTTTGCAAAATATATAAGCTRLASHPISDLLDDEDSMGMASTNSINRASSVEATGVVLPAQPSSAKGLLMVRQQHNSAQTVPAAPTTCAHHVSADAQPTVAASSLHVPKSSQQQGAADLSSSTALQPTSNCNTIVEKCSNASAAGGSLLLLDASKCQQHNSRGKAPCTNQQPLLPLQASGWDAAAAVAAAGSGSSCACLIPTAASELPSLALVVAGSGNSVQSACCPFASPAVNVDLNQQAPNGRHHHRHVHSSAVSSAAAGGPASTTINLGSLARGDLSRALGMSGSSATRHSAAARDHHHHRHCRQWSRGHVGSHDGMVNDGSSDSDDGSSSDASSTEVIIPVKALQDEAAAEEEEAAAEVARLSTAGNSCSSAAVPAAIVVIPPGPAAAAAAGGRLRVSGSGGGRRLAAAALNARAPFGLLLHSPLSSAGLPSSAAAIALSTTTSCGAGSSDNSLTTTASSAAAALTHLALPSWACSASSNRLGRATTRMMVVAGRGESAAASAATARGTASSSTSRLASGGQQQQQQPMPQQRPPCNSWSPAAGSQAYSHASPCNWGAAATSQQCQQQALDAVSSSGCMDALHASLPSSSRHVRGTSSSRRVLACKSEPMAHSAWGEEEVVGDGSNNPVTYDQELDNDDDDDVGSGITRSGASSLTAAAAAAGQHQSAAVDSNVATDFARPIAGIIVRVKQCKGSGFYKHPLASQKSSGLKRCLSL